MRLIDADTLKDKLLYMGYMDDEKSEIEEVIDSWDTEQAVPILELKHLRDEMDKILTNTTAEQNVKWTCIAMIDDLIEDYDGDKRED